MIADLRLPEHPRSWPESHRRATRYGSWCHVEPQVEGVVISLAWMIWIGIVVLVGTVRWAANVGLGARSNCGTFRGMAQTKEIQS